ncbi:hypothetical protein H4S08_004404 [Coemansia sp. RSA 1365]|nr:hypothetical protein H4S08_004404 [Coemansia sp. RSA 1365]
MTTAALQIQTTFCWLGGIPVLTQELPYLCPTHEEDLPKTKCPIGLHREYSPLTRKNWLISYIVFIVGAVLVETGIGIWMWSRTLDIDDLYGHNWRYLWTDDIKRSFQDKGNCCGYLNSQDSPAPGSDSCTNTAIPYGCMVSVQQYTHGYLTYIYSWLFGFVFVAIVALLAAMVLMVVRNDEERLRWSRANVIFRSLKKANSDTTLYGPEPKSYQDDLYKSIYSVSAQ